MANLNWIRVLTSHGIEFVERGPNVKKGHINIKCPFCGQSDPSHHMGLELSTGYWGCWRNKSHRGKSPIRILVKLLRCSYNRAFEIAGIDRTGYVDPDGYDAIASRILGKNPELYRVEEVRRDFLRFPKDFVTLQPSGKTRHLYSYVVSRGFLSSDITLLGEWYSIRGAVSGEFHNRIILPYIVADELVSWTGRTISSLETLRYRDLSLENSLEDPKSILFNQDAGYDRSSSYLIVVEGPFDAIKLDFYGREWGVRSVGVSTNSLSDSQAYLLDEMSENFKNVIIMLDSKNQLDYLSSVNLKNKLEHIPNITYMKVPFGKKDAGELTASTAISFCRQL